MPCGVVHSPPLNTVVILEQEYYIKGSKILSELDWQYSSLSFLHSCWIQTTVLSTSLSQSCPFRARFFLLLPCWRSLQWMPPWVLTLVPVLWLPTHSSASQPQLSSCPMPLVDLPVISLSGSAWEPRTVT